MTLKRTVMFLAVAIIVASGSISTGGQVHAQQTPSISPQAMQQIAALLAEKASLTPTQRKVDSRLLHVARVARGDVMRQGVPQLDIALADVNERGTIVEVRAPVTQSLLDLLISLGAELVNVNARYESIQLRAPLDRIETIAALPQVAFVQPKQEWMTARPLRSTRTMSADPTDTPLERRRNDRTAVIGSVKDALNQSGVIVNVGSRNSEGDAKHRADWARAIYGVSGSGVKVGVLSNGVTNLATAQALGDLGAVTILPGQAGSGDEGTAMLEIIHDLAPNAQLYFATGVTSIASFAQNIRDLRAAGCQIIVDDIGYWVETPFQDGQTTPSQTNAGIVIQAVKDVTASGALYFSSAGNSGNKNDGTSGTWEGDFVDGGAATGPLAGLGTVHNFGGQTFDVVTATARRVTLHWNDPLGASNNDYDVFILNSSGTTLFDFSMNVQNGTQDPFEQMGPSYAGERIVIVKYAGAGRFLHLATNDGRLQTSTAGETHGHSATTAANSFGVAATSAQVNGLNPFNPGHAVEYFSSDGPRRIFFQASGAAFTPGNLSSSGGSVLQKPDLTAADGVSVTGVGGFPSPFYGTSAAAPHAAAIAALVWSTNLSQSASQVRAALMASAIDIETPGVDRDSGVGIIMADTAVAIAVGPPPSITAQPANQTVTIGQTATFSISASGATSYRWQVSTDGGASWPDVTNAPPYGGVFTPTLTIASVHPGFNGVLFRCVVSNAGGSVTSGSALLTVQVPPPSITMQPTNQIVSRGRTATFTIAATGATTYLWQASSNGGATWTNLSNGAPFSGVSTPSLTIANVPLNFNGALYRCVVSNASGSVTSQAAILRVVAPNATDFDSDGKADLAVYRPSSGTWYIRHSASGYTTYASYQWGVDTDIPVAGDYDGDGRQDPAVYRPSTGFWYVLLSSTGYTDFLSQPWGTSGDMPVTGDYDGDGKSDLAVYRPSTGNWYVKLSSTNYMTYQTVMWGVATDRPVPGDYDGDGRTDYAVYRPSTGFWYTLLSTTNYTDYTAVNWGTSTDVTAQSDYDGDGRTDPAVFRPSTGTWYALLSGGGSSPYLAINWGLATDIPVPNDYDGDGRTDLGIFRPSNGTWYMLLSTTNYSSYLVQPWGISTDIPQTR